MSLEHENTNTLHGFPSGVNIKQFRNDLYNKSWKWYLWFIFLLFPGRYLADSLLLNFLAIFFIV